MIKYLLILSLIFLCGCQVAHTDQWEKWIDDHPTALVDHIVIYCEESYPHSVMNDCDIWYLQTDKKQDNDHPKFDFKVKRGNNGKIQKTILGGGPNNKGNWTR